MALGKRIGVVAAIMAFVLLVASAGLYWLFDRVTSDAQERAVRPGWLDSLHAAGRAPDLAGLALERQGSGDGAALAYDSGAAWRPERDVTPLYGALTRHRPMTAADSGLWKRVAADGGLDRIVAYARMPRWDAAPRAAAGDSTWVWGLRLPAFARLREAFEGLIVRAYWRSAHRDEAGARADVGAVLALGEQMARREPTMPGTFFGRSWIRDGARACAELAGRGADTARASRCTRLAAASGRPYFAIFGALQARADTAALVAADAALPLGLRAEALQALALHSLLRMRGLIFGPPQADIARLQPFLTDRDADLARMAAITQRTAERLRHRSIRDRLRAMGGTLRVAP